MASEPGQSMHFEVHHGLGDWQIPRSIPAPAQSAMVSSMILIDAIAVLKEKAHQRRRPRRSRAPFRSGFGSFKCSAKGFLIWLLFILGKEARHQKETNQAAGCRNCLMVTLSSPSRYLYFQALQEYLERQHHIFDDLVLVHALYL